MPRRSSFLTLIISAKLYRKKDVSASEGQPLENMVKSTLTSLHSDASFELFWESVNAKSQLLEVDEPRLPRKKKTTTAL